MTLNTVVVPPFYPKLMCVPEYWEDPPEYILRGGADTSDARAMRKCTARVIPSGTETAPNPQK